MKPYELIIKYTDEIEDKLVTQRRDFHKYAEKGWLEMRTSSIIARKLTKLGYEVLTGEQVCLKEARMGLPTDKVLDEHYQWAVVHGADPEFVTQTKGGMTGVIGILRCGEGPTVAMRFDIDALGVFEDDSQEHRPAREGFASVNVGSMHACGHDGHATIGLGVAEVLMKLKKQLHGTIKLIFQPAEEGVRGAKSIVENGHLEHVDYFISSHVSNKDAGEGGVVIPGSHGLLATTKYDVRFIGKSAHAGAAPEKGKNVLLALAAAITNLYAIPRHSQGVTRVNVGTVKGGSGRNVIPDEAFMEMEVRGATTEINTFMKEYARNIFEGASKMHGVDYEIKEMGSAKSMASDAFMMTFIKDICEQRLHLPVSKTMSLVSGGSEDVSYMVNRVQEQGGYATFMRLLTEEAGLSHGRRFDFDESVLSNGVKIFCAAVYRISEAFSNGTSLQ